MTSYPREGYLRVPLSVDAGGLSTCSLDESIRRYIELCLRNPAPAKGGPCWLKADSSIGCVYPHSEYEVLASTLATNPGGLRKAIRDTIEKCEPRVDSVSVEIVDAPIDDPARQSAGGGIVKLAKMRCILRDRSTRSFSYSVVFRGRGPISVTEARR